MSCLGWWLPQRCASRGIVTLRNMTGEEFDPSRLHLRLRSTFAEAVQTFDVEQGVMGRPSWRSRRGLESQSTLISS